MRIYAACLASYNSGILYGRWIDVAGEWVDEIRDQISAMLEKSLAPDAEEYAIHDYDDLPNFGEHPDLQAIADYSRLVDSAAESGYNQDEVRAIVDNYNGNIDDAEKALENAFGVWDSWRDYADEHADERSDGHALSAGLKDDIQATSNNGHLPCLVEWDATG